MPDAPSEIIFYASVPDIQNAISFRGSGDGGRIILEVPRTESGALLLIQQFGTGKLLRITAEIINEKVEGLNDPDDRVEDLDDLPSAVEDY
jgi:hypothetical protein